MSPATYDANSSLVNHGSTLVGFKEIFCPINRVGMFFVKKNKLVG